MKDIWGRTNNRCQAIKELDFGKMGYLLFLIKNNPQNYPNSLNEWLDWLEEESGESIEKF